MICENCGKEHDGSFGSGRFCSKSCANSRKLSETTKFKISKSLRKEKRYCSLCGKSIKRTNKTGYCLDCLRTSSECKELRTNTCKYASSKVKHHRPTINTYSITKNNVEYLYTEHNDTEIEKWLSYVRQLNINIPQPSVRRSQNYYVLTNCHKHTKGTHFEFEHIYKIKYIMNYKDTYTVHHIDNNGLNNNLSNLLVFNSDADHKRFHKSKYAWLIYDSKTKTFKTILKKNK